ncbi:hypothetical protein [Scytonema sp. NUACC26]|uniref:hypothetical protein n=1 Tax=Scytonema sp. NUACC26 TaxID=3140176 RepID=UPI0034DB9487
MKLQLLLESSVLTIALIANGFHQQTTAIAQRQMHKENSIGRFIVLMEQRKSKQSL